MGDIYDQVKSILEDEIASFQEAIREASWLTGLDLVEHMQADCEKDSGATAASIYATEGEGRSTYGDAVGRAQGLVGGGSGKTTHVEILGEEAPVQSSSNHETVVAVAAKSGFYLENGYGPEGHRSPKPFFDPNTSRAESIFTDHLAALLRR